MFFDSPVFLFLFLPVVIFIYFLLCKRESNAISRIWLVSASIFFYCYLNIMQISVLLISVVINYFVSRFIRQTMNDRMERAKIALLIGIVFNCGLLAYFKYSNFFISNLNQIAGWKINLLNTALPLGISFFTFSQIAYLVDSYRQEIKTHNFIDYALFVTFFPKLLSGPITRFNELMTQFGEVKKQAFNHVNFSNGIYLIFIGLFKKIVLSDIFGVWANNGFDQSTILTFFEAWSTSLSYTFQLYFDFSGYTDMAIGIALLMNIKLPINFDSPYRATNIRNFWRQWHITLSSFIWEFIYVPLGGNKISAIRTTFNLMLTFLICGLWHGAAWTFILWGLLHGFALVIQRMGKNFNIVMPKLLAWFLTFNFINIAWVFFRAKSFDDAAKVLKGMGGVNGLVLPDQILSVLPEFLRSFIDGAGSMQFLADGTIMGFIEMILIFVLAFVMIIFLKNTNQMSVAQKKAAFVFTIPFTIQHLFFTQVTTPFIYFRF